LGRIDPHPSSDIHFSAKQHPACFLAVAGVPGRPATPPFLIIGRVHHRPASAIQRPERHPVPLGADAVDANAATYLGPAGQGQPPEPPTLLIFQTPPLGVRRNANGSFFRPGSGQGESSCWHRHGGGQMLAQGEDIRANRLAARHADAGLHEVPLFPAAAGLANSAGGALRPASLGRLPIRKFNVARVGPAIPAAPISAATPGFGGVAAILPGLDGVQKIEQEPGQLTVRAFCDDPLSSIRQLEENWPLRWWMSNLALLTGPEPHPSCRPADGSAMKCDGLAITAGSAMARLRPLAGPGDAAPWYRRQWQGCRRAGFQPVRQRRRAGRFSLARWSSPLKALSPAAADAGGISRVSGGEPGADPGVR